MYFSIEYFVELFALINLPVEKKPALFYIYVQAHVGVLKSWKNINIFWISFSYCIMRYYYVFYFRKHYTILMLLQIVLYHRLGYVTVFKHRSKTDR